MAPVRCDATGRGVGLQGVAQTNKQGAVWFKAWRRKYGQYGSDMGDVIQYGHIRAGHSKRRLSLGAFAYK